MIGQGIGFKEIAKFGGIGLVLGMVLLPVLLNIYTQYLYGRETNNYKPLLDSTLGQIVAPEKIIYEQSTFLGNVTLKQEIRNVLPSQFYNQLIAQSQTALIDNLGIFILIIFGLSYLVIWIAGWREKNVLYKLIAVFIVILIIYPIMIMVYNIIMYQAFFPPYVKGIYTFILNFGEIFNSGILVPQINQIQNLTNIL